VTIFAFGN
jgi:hypothetical protein